MIEKRRDERAGSEGRAVLRLSEWPLRAGALRGEAVGLTADVSIGGARVRTTTPFPVGAGLQAELVLPGAPRLVQARARVRWRNEVFLGRAYELGLEFVRLEPRDLDVLLGFLSARTPVPPAR